LFSIVICDIGEKFQLLRKGEIFGAFHCYHTKGFYFAIKELITIIAEYLK